MIDGTAALEFWLRSSTDHVKRLSRTTATEDDEVVGERDNVGTERFTRAAQTPVFQEPVHIDVGEQRTRDTALRRAACSPLAARHPPGSVLVALLDRCFEPHLDDGEHVAIHDTPSD